MSIDLTDDREYAWLLVRSDTVTTAFLEVWESIPIRPGSWLAMLLGYPVRLLLVAVFVVFATVVGLAMLLAAVQLPVALFAFVHALLPDLVWQVLLVAFGLGMLGYLVLAFGGWLASASRGDEPQPGVTPSLLEGVVPSAVDPTIGWDRWRSVHVGHDSTRTTLFASGFLVLGVVIQCLAVLAGAEAFSGPVGTAWRWPLYFAEQLFQTMLLGIPIGLVPEVSGIGPATVAGRLLITGVNVFFASGAIALMVQILGSAFKPRELFKGTTRELADHLENADISAAAKLMIHRVGVVRPLDEAETVSLSKAEFFATLQARGSE